MAAESARSLAPPQDDVAALLELIADGLNSVDEVLGERRGRLDDRDRSVLEALLRSLHLHFASLDRLLVARYQELEGRGARDPELESQALHRNDLWRQLQTARSLVDEAEAQPMAPAVEATVEPDARHRRLAMAGTVLTVFGALVVGFVLYEFWMSDLSEQRAQRTLAAEFETVLLTATAGTEPEAEINAEFGEFGVVEPEQEEATGPEVVDYVETAKGSPVAVLRIPAIDLEKVTVEGTGATELKSGPGHYRASPMPGQPGNAIIVGHRTTYGEPFRDLDELGPGDKITVTTPQGIFTYRVTDSDVINPGDPDVLEQGDENQLTLVTAHPEFQANSRFVVRAELMGDAVLPSEQELEAQRKGLDTPITPDETGTRSDGAAWVAVVLWGELLILTLFVARRLYRRWLRWPTWLITTPIVIALAFLLFESIDRLLPSTL